MDDDPFVPQSELRDAARELSRGAFVARWPRPLLWVVTPPGTAKRRQEVVSDPDARRSTILQGEGVQADPAAAAYQKRATSLRKRPHNPFPEIISIGRARNNDLVLALNSVSKLHAYFLETQHGWTLTDWGSTNGSMVDDQRLEPRTKTPVSPGSRIGFGKDFLAVFRDPAELYEELRSESPPGGSRA